MRVICTLFLATCSVHSRTPLVPCIFVRDSSAHPHLRARWSSVTLGASANARHAARTPRGGTWHVGVSYTVPGPGGQAVL
ncbi:hypothetical protein BC628DRAFT_911170 [Trametes gibbosa]|nr:hypothetical protein BC628DRAFT_911170 [Trametes gibbosa]